MIGIKSALNKTQLRNKLFPGLELVELYLTAADFKDLRIPAAVTDLNKQYPRLKFMLHCPVLKDGIYRLGHQDHTYIEQMLSFCRNNVMGFVLHLEDIDHEDSLEHLEERLSELRKRFPKLDDYMYLENIPKQHSKTAVGWKHCIQALRIKNICFDLCHFTAHHNEEELMEMMLFLATRNTYFHIADNIHNGGQYQPLNIGKGNINFQRFAPMMRFGIIETCSENEDIGKEMREDYEKFQQLRTLTVQKAV